MLHGYCIRAAADPEPAEGLAGVEGQPVRSLSAAGLQLWYSDAAPDQPTVERLREHDRVVRAALRTATPLPLRFGSRFASEEEAAATLGERAANFRAALDRVRDRVEMSVRVSLAEPPPEETPARPTPPAEPAAPSPGRRYLEARRERLAAEAAAVEGADRVLAELEEELRDLGLETVRTPMPHGDLLGTLAHLVQTSGLRPYRQRILDLRSQHPELRINLSGPWAPYSFV